MLERWSVARGHLGEDQATRLRQGRTPADGHKIGLIVEGGAMRGVISCAALQALEELGMKQEPFESYLNTFKIGMPLHGGFAIGLERLTAKICNMESVKMATLFPRDTERLTP